MARRLEVLFSPAEFAELPRRDLSKSICVVFDILRATSTMMTALANGAREIVPVADIPEALAKAKQHPGALLAGERGGFRIRAEQTGGTDFDLANSPREFTEERVKGRTIITTTTNGTRALRAAAGAGRVLIGSFLGMEAARCEIEAQSLDELIVVCSGTEEEAAMEDTLAAGALCARVWPWFEKGHIADSAAMAREIYLRHEKDLVGAMALARNGRRLLSIPELRDDVAFCLQRDTLRFGAEMTGRGVVRKLNKFA